MRAATAAALALLATGCAGPGVESVVDDYQGAMEARERHPEWSRKQFDEVRTDGAEVLTDAELPAIDRAVVASVRIRACVETGDYAGAEETIAAHAGVFRALDPALRAPGDIAGIALLKARAARNPDHAVMELTAARERTSGPLTHAFLDLKLAEALLAKAAAEKDAARAKRALETAVATAEANAEGPLAERFAAIATDAKAKLAPPR